MKSSNTIPYTLPHGITIPLTILFIIILSSSLLRHVDAQSPHDSSSSSANDDDDDYALEGSKVSPSMALIVIVLVLGFFVTGCVSIYIQQCSGNSFVGDPVMLTRVGNTGRPEARGLDLSVIGRFPTFVYSDVKELKIGKGALECAVCLNEFEDHETLRLIPKCDHVFHPECIDAWLTGHTTCPVCRADLIPDPSQPSVKEESRHGTADESGLDSEVRVDIIDTVVPQLPKGRVPRSHSTGHSLACSGQDRDQNRDRFTLRLPDEVRKQLVVAQPRLKRTISLVALPQASSSRRGYRNSGDGSGSSRYGRFFGRSFKWISTRNNSNDNGNGNDEGSTRSKRFFGTVVTPVEALPRVPV